MIAKIDWCRLFLSVARRTAVVAVLAGALQMNSAIAIAEDAGQYVVGANDVLTISVFDQPQLTGKYLVQADGTITFPLIGRVKLGGLSMQESENRMRQALADGFLKNPQVGVTVEQYRSQQVIVIGEVRTPGTLEFSGSMTLMTALARAGSTTDRAAFEVLVVRPAAGAAPVIDRAAIERGEKTGDAEVTRVDLEVLQNGAVSQNMVLRGGDTVLVPRAATVFVSGHVTTPGEYTIRKSMTVLQVLTLAGGVTDRGSASRIQTIRKVNGQDRRIDTKLLDIVQPNDTIVVRERFF